MNHEIVKCLCWTMLFLSMCMTVEAGNWYAVTCVIIAACLFVIRVECKS